MNAQDLVALLYGVAAFAAAKGAQRRQAAADHPCSGQWLTWADGRMHRCTRVQGHDEHRVQRFRWCRCRCGARFPAVASLPREQRAGYPPMPPPASAECDGTTTP